MKLFKKSWLLPATCTIILVVTTYATSTEAAKQKQAEVNLQQQQQRQLFDAATAASVAATKPLKYGDRTTTKKIPNGELLLLSNTTTPPPISKNITNVITSRNGQRSRAEYIELPTTRPRVEANRRYNSESRQNQLIVQQQQQHDIPVVHKSRELLTPALGHNNQLAQQQQQQQRHQQQQQRIQSSTNRSRSQNTITTPTNHGNNQQRQQQPYEPTQYSNFNSNLNFGSEKNVAKTKTTITTMATTSKAIAKPAAEYRQPPATRYANNSTPSSIVAHHQNRNNLNNNNNNNNRHNVAIATSSSAKARVSSVSPLIITTTATTNTISPRSRSSTAIKTTTTTTTQRPQSFQFPGNFNFNIFSPEFWQFLSPTTTPAPYIPPTTTVPPTTKRPPKKYRPPTQISTKEEKLNLVNKPKQNIPSRSITTTSSTTTKKPEDIRNNNNIIPGHRDDGPFRIALPTFNILGSRRETEDDGEKGKRNVENEVSLRERFDCPRESEVRFQLFPKICKIDDDCKVWNREEICCEIFGAKSCVTGLPKPLEETSHAPILGVIPRKCPSRPLAELWWEVKECETDMDCWPRVCCPDGRRRYCLSEYLECTPPPPPIFDLHPKTCTSTLDCFPNVCCQEAGLRHCRPPKKSVLTMLANVFNVDFVKRLTQNIVIK
ncbi:hypothetical protein DOY81_004362 [Sarcophaga bullata]|nr:hypothetical protein DOY81_004362 [Sarcophaga bullata]